MRLLIGGGKIDSSDSLPVAVLGDSDALQIGETAIAIGNPLGLEFQGTVRLVLSVH